MLGIWLRFVRAFFNAIDGPMSSVGRDMSWPGNIDKSTHGFAVGFGDFVFAILG